MLALSLVLAILLAVQRNLSFSKGVWGMWTDDSLPLFLWGLVCLLGLLATRPWVPVSRFGAPLRWLGISLAGTSVVFVFLCTTSWGRYRIIRFEALSKNLGISNFERVPLDRPILEEPGTGEYVAKDAALRHYAFQQSGSDFLRSPRAAGVLTALELASGTSFDELIEQPGGPEILLGCLVNEANPHRWRELPWFTPPSGTVLSEEQSRRLVKRLAVESSRQSSDLLENLLFVAMAFPQYFEDAEREEMFDAWPSGFEDLQPLAVEGLLVRRQMKELLPPGKTEVSVAITLSGGVPSTYYYRNVDEIAKLMLLGLIRSCGVRVEETAPESADLNVNVALSEIAHHTYSKPTYDYETYYENRFSSVGRYNNFRIHKIAKQRQVVSGHTEETAYAPVAVISVSNGQETLEFPEMLLFWHHLRYDKAKGGFIDLQGEKTYGRMWPFGLHKRLFEWDEE